MPPLLSRKTKAEVAPATRQPHRTAPHHTVQSSGRALAPALSSEPEEEAGDYKRDKGRPGGQQPGWNRRPGARGEPADPPRRARAGTCGTPARRSPEPGAGRGRRSPFGRSSGPARARRLRGAAACPSSLSVSGGSALGSELPAGGSQVLLRLRLRLRLRCHPLPPAWEEPPRLQPLLPPPAPPQGGAGACGLPGTPRHGSARPRAGLGRRRGGAASPCDKIR